VTTADLNLRAGPGTAYAVKTTLLKAAIVTLIGEEKDRWCKASYLEFSGFVSAKYLTGFTPIAKQWYRVQVGAF